MRVFLSLLLALALAIVPLPEWATDARPDWLALMVIYWSLALPRKFGIGSAWTAGLALDALTGTLLGQHALGLSLIAFISLKFHLRIRVFPIWQQTMTVFMMLAINQFVLFWVDGLAGAAGMPPTRWLPVVTGTLLWPLIAQLLGAVRSRRRGA
ncbi:MAG: rod shape-determining protein MreD [Gammaproteobacteria bacterium]|nr:rod shape-determining protein MreD [Gammaproteobacteria bacterium]